jgi:hypothetical protein
MKRLRASIFCASALAVVPLLAGAMPGPTRVGPAETTAAPSLQSLELENPGPAYPTLIQYDQSGSPGAPSTPEIISHVGEVLAAISNPERRSQLAEQWLRYAQRAITRDQDLQAQWLALQQQQYAQQQQTAQLHLQMQQLQLQIEQLHAQNLQLEQQLAQRAGGQAPYASLPPAPSQ